MPFARSLAEEWGPDGDEDGEAKRLARALHETVPVIAGAGAAAAAAYRWKCQLNENAKLPAFAAELPEAGHNEIVGWSEASDLARFAAVFLEDPGAGERMQARIELTAEIVGGQAAVVERVAPRGETPLQRLVSHVLLGDLVSLYLAVLRGTDPIRRRADRPPQGGPGGALSVRLRSVVTAHASAVAAHAATIAARGPSALDELAAERGAGRRARAVEDRQPRERLGGALARRDLVEHARSGSSSPARSRGPASTARASIAPSPGVAISGSSPSAASPHSGA